MVIPEDPRVEEELIPDDLSIDEIEVQVEMEDLNNPRDEVEGCRGI